MTIKELHEKVWDCKFNDWKDYVGSWFVVFTMVLFPWVAIGYGLLKDEGHYWGFVIWPIVLVLIWMLAKGMSDNMTIR